MSSSQQAHAESGTSPLESERASSAVPNGPISARKASAIDIHKALNILSARAASGDGDHDHDAEGCHAHQTEDKRTMGQTIALDAPANAADEDNTLSANDADSIRKEQEKRREQRAAEFTAKLKSMTIRELLKTVMKAQEQRVSTYQEYNEDVNKVLDSGNMSAYITGCTHATASFAVLSETIITVRKALVDIHKRHDLEKLLNNLQKHEKQKLDLTAALHLERIREQNENVANVDGADKRISKLLNEGVKSLREKIAKCVENINDAMEEIRFALLDEEE